MGVPQVYRKTPERSIATFDFTELASGLGFVDFFLAASAGKQNINDHILDSSKRGTGTTDGKIATGKIYDFRTSNFNLPRTLKGDAYLYGEVAFSSGTITITAEVFIFDNSNISLGSVTWNDVTETCTQSDSFILSKTIDNIDDFVFKSTNEVKRSTGPGATFIFHKYIYSDGNTFDTDTQPGNPSDTYVVQTFTNPFQSKLVDKIEVYIRGTTANSTEICEQETDVYKADGIIKTSISSSIISQDITANSGFLIRIPLTQTNIKGGDKVMVRLTTTGTGSITIDPLALFSTDQTAILSLPFRIDV